MHRSIEDNLMFESQQNYLALSMTFILVGLYIGVTMGYFPNVIHNRFGLAIVAIAICIGSIFACIGFTFYWNSNVMLLTAQVLPFLLLALGVDNMYLILQAEDKVPP